MPAPQPLIATPRHIVVATDFSATSDQAIGRALQIAALLDARISLLHVVEPLPVVSAWGDPGGVSWVGVDALVEAGTTPLALQAERHPGLAAYGGAHHCRVGLPRRDIGSLAAEIGGDLLVLGTRCKRNLGDRLLGSTAQASVNHCPIPLLVVRRPPTSAWSQVLAATDFSAPSLRAAAFGEILAPTATHRLLYVQEPLPEATVNLMQPDPGSAEAYAAACGKEAAQRLEGETKRLGSKWSSLYRRGDPIDIMLAETERRAIDLICLGSRGHGPWIGAFLGSVSQLVLARCDTDVLVVPA